MNAAVKLLLLIAAAVVVFVIAVAVIPDKDCAGNNTWKTSEVCQTGK